MVFSDILITKTETEMLNFSKTKTETKTRMIWKLKLILQDGCRQRYMDGKRIQCLSERIAACTYLSSTVSQ